MKSAIKPDYNAIYAELARLPENFVGEIIDGELHAQPRPAPKHALAASILGVQIGQPYALGNGGPGGWWILDEPECRLSDHVLVPDIAGWRLETMPEIPDTAQFTIRPDWVCEVLSPSTMVKDRNRKLPIYAAAGVVHAWLVDPIAKTVEVFELSSSHTQPTVTVSGNDLLVAPPFIAANINLQKLWV